MGHVGARFELGRGWVRVKVRVRVRVRVRVEGLGLVPEGVNSATVLGCGFRIQG